MPFFPSSRHPFLVFLGGPFITNDVTIHHFPKKNKKTPCGHGSGYSGNLSQISTLNVGGSFIVIVMPFGLLELSLTYLRWRQNQPQLILCLNQIIGSFINRYSWVKLSDNQGWWFLNSAKTEPHRSICKASARTDQRQNQKISLGGPKLNAIKTTIGEKKYWLFKWKSRNIVISKEIKQKESLWFESGQCHQEKWFFNILNFHSKN